MIVNFIDYLKERLPAVKLLCYIAAAIIVIWSMAAVDTSHAHTWAEKHVPGFWAVFAFLSSVILIFLAGWLGRSGIQTKEDYYDK